MKYLDDRPVFEDDRRIAEAWARGGREAETAEREAIKQEKRDKERRNAEAFRRMQEEAREKRQRELLEGAVREPWEADEGDDVSSDEDLETEDDFAPDGETAGSKAAKEGAFKMKIIDIEDEDESSDEEEPAAAAAPPVRGSNAWAAATKSSAAKSKIAIVEEDSDDDEGADEESAPVAGSPAPSSAKGKHAAHSPPQLDSLV